MIISKSSCAYAVWVRMPVRIGSVHETAYGRCKATYPVIKEHLSCCRFTAGSQQVWGQLSQSRWQPVSSHLVTPSLLTSFCAKN